MDFQDIAKICHQANKAYCETLGDNSQVNWEDAPDWQKESAIKGVLAKMKHHMIAPAQIHNLWMREKLTDGWVYGEVKDVEKKTHPCLKPYKELPPEQRMKDKLFLTIVGAFVKG